MRAMSGEGGRGEGGDGGKVKRRFRRGGLAVLGVLVAAALPPTLLAALAKAGSADHDVPRIPEGRTATGPASEGGDGGSEGGDGGKEQGDRGKGERRLRRGGLAVLGVLVAAAFLATLFVVYGTVSDNRWYKIVAIQGSSMTPTLEQGDAIVITRPPARLKPGMVVVLQVDGSLVTHRVVAVRRDGSFVTKGDANDVRDDWTGTKVRVAGLVRADIPFLGRVLRTLGSAAWLTDRVTVPAGGSSSAEFPATVLEGASVGDGLSALVEAEGDETTATDTTATDTTATKTTTTETTASDTTATDTTTTTTTATDTTATDTTATDTTAAETTAADTTATETTATETTATDGHASP